MKKGLIFFLCIILGTLCVRAVENGERTFKDLKILYVGYDPDNPLPRYSILTGGNVSNERYQEDMRSRMPSFKSLLETYFTSVTTIDARDYNEKISEDYDVTIFDGLPEPIEPEIRETDPITGRTTKYKAPVYLSREFSAAAVLIAQNAARIGEPIGYKSNWYCMCLYGHAFNTNEQHPIFNEPLKIKLTYIDRRTPPNLLHYPSGSNLPEEIPMWQVQTESSKDGKGYRTGMVSYGEWFKDSPDSEYISGGECLKDYEAAAIARHANFLLWGFAGSPDYMTDAAKKAFINSIYYISHFKGKVPLIRAYDRERLRPRKGWDYNMYQYSYRKFQLDSLSGVRFNESGLKEQELARKKEKAGQELSADEKRLLQFTPHPTQTWRQYLEKQLQLKPGEDLQHKLDSVLQFYKDNRDYYRGGPVNLEGYDMEAKRTGIPNYDKRILEESIRLWETGEDPILGKTLLERYTFKKYTDPGQWRVWYEKYSDYLVFSESAGYKFVVDSYHHPEFYNERFIGEETFSPDIPDEDNPVTFRGKVLPMLDGSWALLLKYSIAEDYYAYAKVSSKDPFTEMTLQLELPDGIYQTGDVILPQELPYHGSEGTTVFKGDGQWIVTLNQKPEADFNCIIFYQYCNEIMCSLPKETIIGIQAVDNR